VPAVLAVLDQNWLYIPFCLYSKKTKFTGIFAVTAEGCSVPIFYHAMKIHSSQLKIWQ
jgi:hypothetical protein